LFARRTRSLDVLGARLRRASLGGLSTRLADLAGVLVQDLRRHPHRPVLAAIELLGLQLGAKGIAQLPLPHFSLSAASACASQKPMSILRYIVAAVVRCSWAFGRSPVR